MLDIEMEILSFDEKIALAELEASKADERVRELKYQKARFRLDILKAMRKQEDTDADS